MTEPESFTSWEEFDPLEYAKRNYESMLPEDRIIIESVIRAIKKDGIKEDQFENAADVGTGPNLYPSMLLSPFVKGKISLIEFSNSNRQYLEKVLGENPRGVYLEHKNNWKKYSKTIEIISDGNFQDSFNKIKNKVEILEGSINNLPHSKFSAVSSFFCAESITDKPEDFLNAIRSLIDSIKPGGFFMFAHMVGSEGYYAGEGTKFPAVNFSEDDLIEAYQSINIISDFHLQRAETKKEGKKAREGYHGMALIIGHKKS
jgi:SAM-dependent methyltransferase